MQFGTSPPVVSDAHSSGGGTRLQQQQQQLHYAKSPITVHKQNVNNSERLHLELIHGRQYLSTCHIWHVKNLQEPLSPVSSLSSSPSVVAISPPPEFVESLLLSSHESDTESVPGVPSDTESVPGVPSDTESVPGVPSDTESVP
eukprot:Lankesteria_metandrocarpae@DN9811_c0_g1_i1.p1